MSDSVAGIPPAYLLAVAFGDLPFSHAMGAYFLYPQQQFRFIQGQTTIVSVHKNGEIGGIYFHMWGFDLFLSLFPGHAPPTLGELGVTNLPPYILSAVMDYRSSSIITTDEDQQVYETKFLWR